MPSLTPTHIALWYLAAISLLSILVAVADKGLAITHARRVPEATLFLLAALGGAAAMLLTMLIIRHKTRKLRFMLGLPLLVLLHAFIGLGIVFLMGGLHL